MQTAFQRTSKAIESIEDDRLRRDFADLAAGIDYALGKEDVDQAQRVIEKLVSLSHALCRTIGGVAAVQIIDALDQDTQTNALLAQQPGTGPGWAKGRCDAKGSRSCVDSKTHSCRSDSEGCISTRPGAFDDIAAGYVWGVVLLG